MAESRGDRKPSAMKDDIYCHVIELVAGSFNVPVRQRTNVHRAATTYYTRNRRRLTIEVSDDQERLCLGNRNFHSLKSCLYALLRPMMYV